MKKVLIGLVVLIVLVFGGLKIFEITNYGGTTYYTKITNAGQQATDHDQDG
ncbi:MAG: YxeA family protein, partial [Lacticaseibacillus paracasei]